MGYFDLKFIRVGKVGGCDIEMVRGNLFDGRVYGIVVGYDL